MMNGTVFATGYNNYGQLGTGTTSTDIVRHEAPVESTEFNKLSSSLLDFSAGGNHTILVTNAGEVYGFGDNQYSQLGMPSDQTAITSLTEIISY
jgi:alpha-tubulin suppressor-like RCC1 family protein